VAASVRIATRWNEKAQAMKLVRYGVAGQERPGLVGSDGRLRDLSMLLPDIGPAQLAPRTLQALALLDVDRLPAVEGAPRLGCPVTGVGKIVCIGLNYADHAREAKLPVPSEPVLFFKATTALNGPNDPVLIPRGAKKVDWEAELGVVIGRTARYLPSEDAMACVAGYTIVNDVSERDYQMHRNGQWDKGKGCDTFAPVGPWLVTADEVPDPHRLRIWLDVNGRRMQDSCTDQLIFDIPQLVSYVSHFMTLQPGDIISTGTPPGVGMGIKPEPVYLRPGDEMRLGVQGLGEQRQVCVAMAGDDGHLLT
jgi:2-keto-4-pentenoate hydratase/2-oxohepta-3-ene-1,7-dioic acid hydratase in catechol pathway